MKDVTLAVILRLADENDMPGLLRIEEDCFANERWSESVARAFLERDDAFIIVAEEGDEIVGSALCVFSDCISEGKIASIAVLRKHRGEGIGSQLLEQCENIFRSRNLDKYSLEVETNNEPAISLYLTREYEVKGIIKDFYSAGRDAYAMEKVVGSQRKVKVQVS